MKRYCFRNYGDTISLEERNYQALFLYNVVGLSASQVSDYVNLAASTIRSYCSKIRYLIDKVKEMFTTEKKEETRVFWECNVPTYPCTYILEYYDKNYNLQYLKVGSSNNLERRINEHLRDYYIIKVKKVFQFAYESAATSFESVLRLNYQQKYWNKFVRQDRFEKVYFDNNDLNTNLVKDVLEILENY